MSELMPAFNHVLIAVRRLRTAIARPWSEELPADDAGREARADVIAGGHGHIANAYRAADLLAIEMGEVPQKGATVTGIH